MTPPGQVSKYSKVQVYKLHKTNTREQLVQQESQQFKDSQGSDTRPQHVWLLRVMG